MKPPLPHMQTLLGKRKGGEEEGVGANEVKAKILLVEMSV